MKKYFNQIFIFRASLIIFTLIAIFLQIFNTSNPEKETTSSKFYESEFNLISKEYLSEAAKHSSFEILNYDKHPFKDLSFSEIKKRFKIYDIPLTNQPLLPITPLDNSEEEKLKQLPANFDPFGKWPNCIHPIRNQLQCGSCWAFAVTDVLSDRLCIASSERINEELSPQDLISCATDQLGCDGGYIERSWQYMINIGAVSSSCFPYSSGYGYIEPCINMCKNSLVIRKKYRASSYRRFNYISQIKSELFNYGPVETGFLVYLDFMNYASGIYTKNSEYFLGGHAVKVIGWGIENGVEYWIAANSWGPNWGEKGFFRFAMSHCCNFESNMITGYARLTKDEGDPKDESTNEIERLIMKGKNLEDNLFLE